MAHNSQIYDRACICFVPGNTQIDPYYSVARGLHIQQAMGCTHGYPGSHPAGAKFGYQEKIKSGFRYDASQDD